MAGGRSAPAIPTSIRSDPYRKGFLYADRDPEGFGLAVGNIHNPGDWMEYKVEIPSDGDYAFWMYYGAMNGPFGRARTWADARCSSSTEGAPSR